MTKKILFPSLLALAVSSAAHAGANDFLENANNGLQISGDFELDTDVNRKNNSNEGSRVEQDGRVLLNIEAMNTFGDMYVYGKGQPLVKLDGSIAVDDVYAEFGQLNSWAMRVGRFEAADLFPMGQDTIADYIADSGEIYKASEGRGRADNGGQLLVNGVFGNLYAEMGTQFGDVSDMGLFLGSAKVSSGNEAVTGSTTGVIRPAVTYTGNGWSATVGAEYFVSNQTVKLQDSTQEVDIDGRYGYGATVSANYGVGDVNVNVAQLRGDDQKSTSYGINTVISQFGLGYAYGSNTFTGNLANNQEDTKVNTAYASYIVDNFIGVEPMAMHLGTYYSWGELENDEKSDMGARVRFVYAF